MRQQMHVKQKKHDVMKHSLKWGCLVVHRRLLFQRAIGRSDGVGSRSLDKKDDVLGAESHNTSLESLINLEMSGT